jgi:hypothetical protein
MTSVQSAQPISERSRQIVVATSTLAQSQGDAILPRAGLNLPGSLSFENWLRIGEILSIVRTSSAWCLGDWLIYGEIAYTGRYRDAIKQTSLDYQTLRNYAWIARRFPMSRRREALSFGHHAEVASLPDPEQDFWLRKAETLGWSTSRLRREVRSSLNWRAAPDSVQASDAADDESGRADVPRVLADDQDADQQQLKLQLKVLPTQFSLCRAAADKAGLSIEEWAVRTLYQAASQPAPH